MEQGFQHNWEGCRIFQRRNGSFRVSQITLQVVSIDASLNSEFVNRAIMMAIVHPGAIAKIELNRRDRAQNSYFELRTLA